MRSNVTIKNVSWPHFSWPTLYGSGWLVRWLGGDTGDLWPNGEIDGVVLNRGHIGNCLCVLDWHHQI